MAAVVKAGARGAAVLCVAAALAVPAGGCRQPAPSGAVVELWAMGREGEVVRQLVAGFGDRVPGVRVRVQQIPWSAAHEKLLTAVVGDTAPDVVQVGTTWLAELVALGALAPLDARLAASARLPAEDFFAGAVAGTVIDGVTWGVPWYVDTRVLFYRTDLVAAAGVPEIPRTWDGLEDALRRVAAKGAGEDRFALLLPLGEWEPLVILALQHGAGLLRDGDRYGDFRAPAFRAALVRYRALFDGGLAPRTGGARVAHLYHDFGEGRFAAFLSGPWSLGELGRHLPARGPVPWATAPLPAIDGQWPGVSLAGGASLAVLRRSRRPELAWRLVEYLCEPAQQLAFYRLSGDLPARRSAWTAGDLLSAPAVRAFWQQLDRTVAPPKIPEWERVAAKIAQYAEAVVRGTLDVDTALARLDADVDAILEKRRWLLGRAAGSAGR